MYPRIRVEGGPRERGRQYGEQARDRVRRSIAAYEQVFAYYAGWDWDRVREEAAGFRDPIERHGARYLEEIRGIAEGAGVDELDVLAINVRTEVMFAAKARQAAAGIDAPTPPLECSAFAVMPDRTVDGRLLVGQNWDWLEHSFDTVVVLEAIQDEGPDYVTVVEAGLLAKTGMNSSGVALATNALVSAEDVGKPGLPYHVLLRSILDSETISDGLAAILRSERSSSANYLLGHEDGSALDVEVAPGDYSRAFLGYPQDGVILHVNHFTSPDRDVRDVSLWAMPDSPFRLERLRELTGPQVGALDVPTLQAALADHVGFPLAVCCHPDRRDAEVDRAATIAAVIMDVGERRLWLASGNPCTAPYETLDYADFLAKPSPLGRPPRSPAA